MKYITISQTFPKYHPNQGQPTHFVDKIIWALEGNEHAKITDPDAHRAAMEQTITGMKHHTIRAGNRWKTGEWCSLRVWTGKPYVSKQKEFAQVKVTVQDIQIKVQDINYSIFVDGDLCYDIEGLVQNDGLDLPIFVEWFRLNKPKNAEFKGQIIGWGDIHYHPMEVEFSFRPQNLLHSLHMLGPWSSYGLAAEAIDYYTGERLSLDGELEYMDKNGFNLWSDMVQKYHTEVGYPLELLSNKTLVNYR